MDYVSYCTSDKPVLIFDYILEVWLNFQPQSSIDLSEAQSLRVTWLEILLLLYDLIDFGVQEYETQAIFINVVHINCPLLKSYISLFC